MASSSCGKGSTTQKGISIMASMVDVMKALDMPAKEFRAEWALLSDQDKEDLKRWTDEDQIG